MSWLRNGREINGNPLPEADDEDVELTPGLVAVSRLAQMIPQVPWFGAVGGPLEAQERRLASAYLDALGFPEVEVAAVADWEEAEAAARNPDWNSAWWEAEEQLRMALIDAACGLSGEDAVMVALTNVTSRASDVVHEAAEATAARFGVDDEALVRAAAGAATQACYQAALVLAAEEEDQDGHPFALKYRLFEAGRWPLGVAGSSFNLF